MSVAGAARDGFVKRRKPSWERLEVLLATPRLRDAEEWSELASLYREVSADLARARALGLPDDVQTFLDRLAGRAHNRLYGTSRGTGYGVLRDLLLGFPQAAWRQWPFVLAAHLLFYGPFILGVVGPLVWDGFAASVLPEAQLEMMEEMYTDAPGRGAGDNAMMAGFYVWNNVGIAFRCFATGALAGLGSAFYLVYNGLVLGTTTGFLWSRGLGWNLLEFTAGHSAWELTGIALSGAAGLRLGWAIVVTEGRTRLGSLRHAAPEIFRLVLGAAALLLVAAAIEGFWSATPAPLPVKIGFGVLGIIAVLAWLSVGLLWRER